MAEIRRPAPQVRRDEIDASLHVAPHIPPPIVFVAWPAITAQAVGVPLEDLTICGIIGVSKHRGHGLAFCYGCGVADGDARASSLRVGTAEFGTEYTGAT